MVLLAWLNIAFALQRDFLGNDVANAENDGPGKRKRCKLERYPWVTWGYLTVICGSVG